MKENIVFPSKKGFTLMEILFVVLVIALVISFAMPAIRAVRFDIKNARAKAALRKVAEARRSYYEYSRGGDFKETVSFEIGSAQGWSSDTCINPAASGVPGTSELLEDASQLFACGFLNWKDFADLPYRFYICKSTDNTNECKQDNKILSVGAVAADSTGGKRVGAKYVSPYKMYIVQDDMEVQDTEE